MIEEMPDVADVRVALEQGKLVRLLHEALRVLRAGEYLEDHFEVGHVLVNGKIDLRHPPGADLFEDFVIADRSLCHGKASQAMYVVRRPYLTAAVNKKQSALRRGRRRGGKLGNIDVTEGIFVDQKWINLFPCFSDDIRILRLPGCNMAYWNLHERKLSKSVDGWLVNDLSRLMFFHFSNLDPLDKEGIMKSLAKPTLKERGDLREYSPSTGNNFTGMATMKK